MFRGNIPNANVGKYYHEIELILFTFCVTKITVSAIIVTQKVNRK